MTPAGVQAVQAMVAPVVLITAGGILSNGFLSLSASVNDRMRTMNAERVDLLTGGRGAMEIVGDLGDTARERITQIDVQLPMLMRRHHLLRDAILVVYLGIAALVVAVVTLGVATTLSSDTLGLLALALVLVGTAGLLGSLAIAGRSVVLSHDAIDYEVTRTLGLGRSAP